MGMKTLKSGEDFSFPKEFGFTGSASTVAPRNHPTMSSDEFGDDAHLKSEGALPTFADGGSAALPGKKIPKAGRAILGALQLGKTIGQAQAGIAKGTGAPVNPAAPAGVRPPMGAQPNMLAPGAGALPMPGKGVIPGAVPGMKKGGFIKGAIKRPGRMKNLAKKHGVSVHQEMERDKHSSDPSLRSAANLGLRLTGGDLAHKRKE